MAELSEQINRLKKLQQDLAPFPSQENVKKISAEIEAALMLLKHQELPRELMNSLMAKANKVIEQAKLALAKDKADSLLRPLEANPGSDGDRVVQRSTKRKRARVAEIEDFSAEEKALKATESAWNAKSESIKDTFSLVHDDKFNVIRTLPEAKQWFTEIDNMQVQFDNLLKRHTEEIQAAGENYPLAWESKKPIKLRNGQMMTEQSALYKAHLEELNTLHLDLNRLTGTLFLVQENASNSNLVEAKEKYAIAKQTVSEMQGYFSRYSHMAQNPDETINAIHRNIELRMEKALERIAAAQTIEPDLNENDATSTLAQIEKYTAAANSINSIMVELGEVKGWLSQQLNSIAPATEQKLEENRVSERQQQITKEMETYLQTAAVSPYLDAKDDHVWIDSTSQVLKQATTTHNRLSKQVKKIDALRTELAGINLAIQAKTFSSDIEDAVLQRKETLAQYEEKINAIVNDYRALQTEVSTSLSDLEQLGEAVEKEWLATLDRNNTTIKELQALASPYSNTSVVDLPDVTPIRGEGKQGIKNQLDAFTALHEDKKKQITSLQNQLSEKLGARIDNHTTQLNKLLTTPSLPSSLRSQLDTAKEALEAMKKALSLPPDLTTFKKLHTNLAEVNTTLETLQNDVERHQRVSSPQYQALEGLGKGIEQEIERLIVKYMGEAMRKFYEQVKDNQNPAQKSELQAIYNSFHELEEKYQLKLHGPDDELEAFRLYFEKGEHDSRNQRIYDLIDPRLKHLDALSQCVEKHKTALLDVSKAPNRVIATMKSELDNQLLPEKLQELSEKRRSKLVQFITKLASVFLPSHLLQTKTQRNLTEITQSFKQKLELYGGTEKQKISSPQNKMSRDAVTQVLNKNTGNASWQNFLTKCLDFKNIEPETRFIKILPLTDQMEKAKMIADFDNFNEPSAMKAAVACVLKALCTPAKSDGSFAHTSAMRQFVEKFNSGEITGEVKEILYKIVDQKPGAKLKLDDFTKKEKEITQLSNAAIEHGFDSEKILRQAPST